jgi:hypothetical protein
LPPAAVHDIEVQGGARELVISTHGRSVFKLDLAPVQDFSDEIAAKEVHLFAIRQAVLPQARDYGGDWALETRQPAAFHYFLKTAGHVSLRILDDKGKAVLEREEQGRAGINVAIWDLVVGGGYASPAVLGPGARLIGSGDYRVEIRAGDAKAEGALTVRKPSQPKIGWDRERHEAP